MKPGILFLLSWRRHSGKTKTTSSCIENGSPRKTRSTQWCLCIAPGMGITDVFVKIAVSERQYYIMASDWLADFCQPIRCHAINDRSLTILLTAIFVEPTSMDYYEISVLKSMLVDTNFQTLWFTGSNLLYIFLLIYFVIDYISLFIHLFNHLLIYLSIDECTDVHEIFSIHMNPGYFHFEAALTRLFHAPQTVHGRGLLFVWMTVTFIFSAHFIWLYYILLLLFCTFSWRLSKLADYCDAISTKRMPFIQALRFVSDKNVAEWWTYDLYNAWR